MVSVIVEVGVAETEAVGLRTDTEGVRVRGLLCVFPLSVMDNDFDALDLSWEIVRVPDVDNERVCSNEGDDVRDGDSVPIMALESVISAVKEKVSETEKLGEGVGVRVLSREGLFVGDGVRMEYEKDSLSSGGLRV